jgi:hypothetical protein
VSSGLKKIETENLRVSLLLRCDKLQMKGGVVFLFRQTEAGRALLANMLVKHINIKEAEGVLQECYST